MLEYFLMTQASPIDITANLARKIKALRKLHKWTAEELARKANITPVYVSQIENNKRKNISLIVVYRIAQAFSVPVSVLIDEL